MPTGEFSYLITGPRALGGRQAVCSSSAQAARLGTRRIALRPASVTSHVPGGDREAARTSPAPPRGCPGRGRGLDCVCAPRRHSGARAPPGAASLLRLGRPATSRALKAAPTAPLWPAERCGGDERAAARLPDPPLPAGRALRSPLPPPWPRGADGPRRAAGGLPRPGRPPRPPGPGSPSRPPCAAPTRGGRGAGGAESPPRPEAPSPTATAAYQAGAPTSRLWRARKRGEPLICARIRGKTLTYVADCMVPSSPQTTRRQPCRCHPQIPILCVQSCCTTSRRRRQPWHGHARPLCERNRCSPPNTSCAWAFSTAVSISRDEQPQQLSRSCRRR